VGGQHSYPGGCATPRTCATAITSPESPPGTVGNSVIQNTPTRTAPTRHGVQTMATMISIENRLTHRFNSLGWSDWGVGAESSLEGGGWVGCSYQGACTSANGGRVNGGLREWRQQRMGRLKTLFSSKHDTWCKLPFTISKHTLAATLHCRL
jgi:hypothetical protein